MSLAQNTKSLIAASVIACSVFTAPTYEAFALGPVLPLDQLEGRFDDLKDEVDEELNENPAGKKQCRKHQKDLKRRQKEVRKLIRLMRNRTTQLRQNPDFNATTDEIIKLQNKIKELRDMVKELNKKRRSAKKDCRKKKAPGDPALDKIVDDAVKAVTQGTAFVQQLQNAVAGAGAGALGQDARDMLQRNIDNSQDALQKWDDLLKAKLYEIYGGEYSEANEQTAGVLQDLRRALKDLLKEINQHERTAQEQIEAADGAGGWVQLCPKNLVGPDGQWIGTTFVPCSEL